MAKIAPRSASPTRKLQEQLRESSGWNLTLEAEILHDVLGADIGSWPARFRGLGMKPTVSADDALALLREALPTWSVDQIVERVHGEETTERHWSVILGKIGGPDTAQSTSKELPAAIVLAILGASAQDFEAGASSKPTTRLEPETFEVR